MNIGIRWTVGDVSSRGFEALALSIIGARQVFGQDAEFVVCVNTISTKSAQERVGPVAAANAAWHDSSKELPHWLRKFVDDQMAQGVAWKFAPIRIFRGRHTLALDNDVILWRLPDGIRRWLEDGDALLIAEDVRACYGQFAPFCPTAPRNSGIVGMPPAFDAEASLRCLLAAADVRLRSETDEQGLQVAIVTREKHRVVELDDVSVCGYFRPHRLELGSCGAHFVGVNSRRLPWQWNGRPGEEYVHGFWDAMKPAVLERLNATRAGHSAT